MHSVTFVAALAGSALALRPAAHSSSHQVHLRPTALSSGHPAHPTIAANASASFNVSRGLTRRQTVNVNDPCAVQPSGTGPLVTPDTPQEFVSHAAFQPMINSSLARVGNYSTNYYNLTAATTATIHYLGYMTLPTYNVTRCKEVCDMMTGCVAFNIYLERDPAVNPNVTAGCPNPASVTNVKCSWWDSALVRADANNVGETRANFNVVIAGSSAFSKKAQADGIIAGYGTPMQLAGYDQNEGADMPGVFIGDERYYVGPEDTTTMYNPQICADRCTAITRAARAAAGPGENYRPCNYFNSWAYADENPYRSTACFFYTTTIPSQYATGNGRASMGFSANPMDSGIKSATIS